MEPIRVKYPQVKVITIRFLQIVVAGSDVLQDESGNPILGDTGNTIEVTL